MKHMKHEFLIKWKGLPQEEASWEPKEHMDNAKEAIKDFYKRNPMATHQSIPLPSPPHCLHLPPPLGLYHSPHPHPLYVTTHGLPHYEYLIRQTGMLTFIFLLIILWLTHMDLPIPLPFALSSSSPFALVTICVPPFAQLLYSLCPKFTLAHHVYKLMYL